jgi:hypothetical protein
MEARRGGEDPQEYRAVRRGGPWEAAARFANGWPQDARRHKDGHEA